MFLLVIDCGLYCWCTTCNTNLVGHRRSLAVIVNGNVSFVCIGIFNPPNISRVYSDCVVRATILRDDRKSIRIERILVGWLSVHAGTNGSQRCAENQAHQIGPAPALY